MATILDGKRVVLGVSGSIAAYKAIDLASRLVQAGATVDPILTSSASKLVSPMTFNAITHRAALTDLFQPSTELSMDHVALAIAANVVVVAPATVNTIAKLAHGIADDALTTTVLATGAPVLVAPAGDASMLGNPATVDNLATLRERGMTVVGPVKGRLASGMTGAGRLEDPARLLGFIRKLLGSGGDYAGRRVVVSAGGTREAIDPVRVITNRSSGKMGYALAEAARDRGADVTLVTAPTSLPDPAGVDMAHIETALEMRDAVLPACIDADLLVMAAAVGDFRATNVAVDKLKSSGNDRLSLSLVANKDWMPDARGNRLVKVAFAAETSDLLANARAKLQSKGASLVVANDVTEDGAGFAADTNRVTILDGTGNVEELPLMEKQVVANRILDRALPFLQANSNDAVGHIVN